MSVSIVIPAYNEVRRIAATLRSLQEGLKNNLHDISDIKEIVVVDDGSEDETALIAGEAGARVFRLDKNRGKGGAITAVFPFLKGDVILILDADLEESAPEALALTGPILSGEADLTIAKFLPGRGGRGFGIAKKTACLGIRILTGKSINSPLSGQRCMSKKVLASFLPLSSRFGMEVGMTIDAFKKGYRVLEVETRLKHCPPGRDWPGFLHRGRQLYDICAALGSKAGRGHTDE